jgi:ABC-type glycerol-3-phosphate transport system substrate-binding protein
LCKSAPLLSIVCIETWVNALFGRRSDILKQLGYNTPPQTYSQVIAMGQKLKQKFLNKFAWVDNNKEMLRSLETQRR